MAVINSTGAAIKKLTCKIRWKFRSDPNLVQAIGENTNELTTKSSPGLDWTESEDKHILDKKNKKKQSNRICYLQFQS